MQCGARLRSFVYGPLIDDLEHRTPLRLEHDVQVTALGDQHRVDERLGVRWWVGEDLVLVIRRDAVAKLGADLREGEFCTRFRARALPRMSRAHGRMVGLPRLGQSSGMSAEQAVN